MKRGDRLGNIEDTSAKATAALPGARGVKYSFHVQA
jgi:hypothetical protein